jgi:nucleoside-diphosphate-sugar epimerase
VFNTTKLSYVFFLACEVGGSKFIESSARNLQIGIIESNIKMYQVVFPWLAAHKIPFVFTSSYLQGTANPYGVIKRLGEQWIHNLGGEGEGLGKTLRLWNVYGSENVGLKSHVLSDWSEQCVRRGFVTARSNGHEIRQFIHAQDVAGLPCGVDVLANV